MSTAVKPRGRPKGSKNKRKAMSKATIAEQCEIMGHNPIEFMIIVAMGHDDRFQMERDIMDANKTLVNLIHGNRRLMEENKGFIDGQFELVFSEDTTPFALPGESGTASVTDIHGQAPIQRAGVSSQDGQDSIRDQQADP